MSIPNPSDGRYAPSPTGNLHVGNLRTALAAWLAARGDGARFAIRIDDLDPDRVRPGIAAEQLDDLRALGMDWDGVPVEQSERLDRYAAALNALDALGLAYPCFCSRADVRAAASAPHDGDGELHYPGTCRDLATVEARRRVAIGEPHCIRLRADRSEHGFEDRVLGRVAAFVDDVVIRRRDGVPAYNLATVVDEHDLLTGTVVRGADLANTTVTQIWIATALDLRIPAFAHVELVLGPDGARLAKRHGAVSRAQLHARGVDDARLLQLLAGSLGIDATDARTASDLLGRADVGSLPAAGVRLDVEALATLGSWRHAPS